MMLTKKDIQTLAEIRTKGCVSLYLPTHKASSSKFIDQDRIMYKNLLSRAATKLARQGYRSFQIDKILDPAISFLDESSFWKYLSDGLAVFIAPNFFRYFSLPMTFDPICYVSEDLCLEPLLPYFTGDGKYYLLTLNLHKVELFEGSRDKIQRSEFEFALPSQIEEVVGSDSSDRFLQFRTQGKHRVTSFHGHAEWQDHKKEEILKFFREIDSVLTSKIRQEDAPLLVCAQEHMFALYKRVNHYNLLFPKALVQNPVGKSMAWLHEESWKLIGPQFKGLKKEKEILYRKLQGTGMTSANPSQILLAAFHSRISTLFINKDKPLFGTFKQETGKLNVSDFRKNGEHSLTNQAAIKTFLNGGCVYLLDEKEMPEVGSYMNAIFRH